MTLPLRLTAPDTPRSDGLEETAAFFDGFVAADRRWTARNAAYYRLVRSLLQSIVRPGASVLEIGCGRGDMLAALRPGRGVGVDVSGAMVEEARRQHPQRECVLAAGETG